MLRRTGEFEFKDFGTFKTNLREMAAWLLEKKVDSAVMESTGIFWLQPFHALAEAGIDVILGNAYAIKNVPGRKTDTSDAKWLASLALCGLVGRCRVLPRIDEELREYGRLREKTANDMAGYKNRLHKLLVKGGFALDQVVTDVCGRTGRLAVKGLLEGRPPAAILKSIECEFGYRLKKDRRVLLDALEGEMSTDLRNQIGLISRKIDDHSKDVASLTDMMERRRLDMGQELEILQTMPGV